MAYNIETLLTSPYVTVIVHGSSTETLLIPFFEVHKDELLTYKNAVICKIMLAQLNSTKTNFY
jgi:hypothetical protein